MGELRRIDAIRVIEKHGYTLNVVVDPWEGISPEVIDCVACGNTKRVFGGVKPDGSKLSICTACSRISNK